MKLSEEQLARILAALRLQIMEEGRLTDSFGRVVDFRNTIVIMTTNAGAEEVTNKAVFGLHKKDENSTYEKMKETLKAALDRYFRPEFLNRLDDIIVFRQLTREDLQKIVDIELEKVYKRLQEKGLTLSLTPEAREYLIDKGFNVEFGARPLRRKSASRVLRTISLQHRVGAGILWHMHEWWKW